LSSEKKCAPLRIWPHHFDTGSFIPLGYNASGAVSKSVGIGWTIPDSMVDEPYYYVSFWTENPDESDIAKNIQPLESGRWITSGWTGAVLSHSDIIKYDTGDDQYHMVHGFFESTINQLKRI
jgi:hypothetical protein